MKKLTLLFICVLFICTGCLSNSGYTVFVTNTKPVKLLPPESFAGEPVDSLYAFELTFSDTTLSCLSWVTVSSSEIFLSAFNDMGISMGEISYTGNDLLYESTFLPENLKAEYVIADIQNIFYEYGVLEQNYGKKGLDVVDERDDADTVRNIYSGNDLIESITFTDDSIYLKNYLRGYEYVLVRVD